MKTLGTLMRKLLAVGVTTGPTFHLELEPGVGLLVVPNARLTRMHCHTVAVEQEIPRRVDGHWQAKPLHVSDKFLGV